jgi:hypothetical protein
MCPDEHVFKGYWKVKQSSTARSQNVVPRGYSNEVKKQAARRAGGCDWGLRYYIFRVRFWRRGGFAPTLANFSSRKISNDFSSKIYCDGAATLHRWRGGAAQLSTILETAVLWRLQLYLNFGRKVVADFSTRKIANVGAKTAATQKNNKSGPETYCSAAPNRNHPHAVQPVFRHYTSSALGNTSL